VGELESKILVLEAQLKNSENEKVEYMLQIDAYKDSEEKMKKEICEHKDSLDYSLEKIK
jgi:hypothetical protein